MEKICTCIKNIGVYSTVLKKMKPQLCFFLKTFSSLHDQTLFDSLLKRTFFSDLIKANNFILSGPTQNNFFAIHLI